MSDTKIIAVMGATGAQGGGLVKAILADKGGGFTARAVTRDPGSDKAKALRDLGAEVVGADSYDPASLVQAFRGAHGAFCVTFFWAHMNVDKEKEEARNLANAAKQAGLEHVIWSTLEDVRKFVPLSDDRMPTLHGKYKVPHFDGKGESDQYFLGTGVPTTLLLTTFYWENLIYFGTGPKPLPDGTLAITLPMGHAKLAGIASDDIGHCAYALFRRGAPARSESVGIAGELLTIADMAQRISRAIGKTVVYNEVPPEVFRSFGFPGADDVGNMFQFYRDFESHFAATRDPAKARALYPGLQTFDQWLAQHAGQIPLS